MAVEQRKQTKALKKVEILIKCLFFDRQTIGTLHETGLNIPI